MADDGSQQRKPDFRTAVDDVKAIAAVFAMEAESIVGRRAARTLGVIALFAVAVAVAVAVGGLSDIFKLCVSFAFALALIWASYMGERMVRGEARKRTETGHPLEDSRA